MKSSYKSCSFPLSVGVNRGKAVLHNRYGIPLVVDLYLPKNAAWVFDPLFISESGGGACDAVSPDINTEDFAAAVDSLSAGNLAASERIGGLGICGFGGMVRNAAAMDTCI